MAYMINRDCSPLDFNFGDDIDKRKVKSASKKMSLDEMVIAMLSLSKVLSSMNLEGVFETRRDKWRSSLDIWRHVKLYKPKATIFDVMDSLFRQQERLTGLYCITIKRRVFRAVSVDPFRAEIYEFRDKNEVDEYNLKFISWKGINK